MVDKLTLIEEATERLNRCVMETSRLAAELKSAKAIEDQARKHREQVIVMGEDALKAQTTLINDAEVLHTNGNGKSEAKGKKPSKVGANKAAIDKAVEEENAWRSRPVGDAIAVGSVINGLETLEVPIKTLGELSDWLKSGKRLADLPGVGVEKESKAHDQWAEFWKANPQSGKVGMFGK